jgi:DNA-binding GntR family transcriptional regulator
MLYNVIMTQPPLGGGRSHPRAKTGGEGADLQFVTRQTLADSVYVQLKTAISKGRLRDGTELKQVELAEQLGVSRVPVREALRRLQAEHLVAAQPFQRFVVTSLTRDQVMELLDLREELEVFALKRTVLSESREQRVRDAKVAAKALSADQDEESWLDADREFHRVLNGATTAVAAIIEDIRERVHRYLYSAGGDPSRRQEVMEEHAAVVAALAAGDAQALEDAIRRHVRNTRRFLEHSFVAAGPSEVDASPFDDVQLAKP